MRAAEVTTSRGEVSLGETERRTPDLERFRALLSAHMAKKIIVTGLGEPVEMKKFIKDGTVKTYQLWNPTNMGTVGTYMAYEALRGVTFPPGKTFSVPGSGLGVLKVAKDGDVWCQAGMTTFNKANVNKYNF